MINQWIIFSDKDRGVVIAGLFYLLMIGLTTWYVLDYYLDFKHSSVLLEYVPYVLNVLPILVFLLLFCGGYLYFHYDSQYGLGLMMGILYGLMGGIAILIAIDFVIFIVVWTRFFVEVIQL